MKPFHIRTAYILWDLWFNPNRVFREIRRHFLRGECFFIFLLGTSFSFIYIHFLSHLKFPVLEKTSINFLLLSLLYFLTETIIINFLLMFFGKIPQFLSQFLSRMLILGAVLIPFTPFSFLIIFLERDRPETFTLNCLVFLAAIWFFYLSVISLKSINRLNLWLSALLTLSTMIASGGIWLAIQ